MHASFRAAGESPFGFGYAIVDPTAPSRVERDAKRLTRRGLVELCTTVDAWAPEASQHGLGRKCLEALLDQPDWTVRILTKNAAVMDDFDLIEQYRSRVLVGLSLTGTEAVSRVLSVIEPSATPIQERMAALQEAHGRGFRTYGMLCPLLPGIADSPAQSDELVDFLLKCGVEEIFVEPVNGRGNGLKLTEEALRAAGYDAEAGAVGRIRNQKQWSSYTRTLLQRVQRSLRSRKVLNKLRFLLYPSTPTEEDRDWALQHPAGVKWLGKNSAGLVPPA